jgi:hypothetical protein
MDDCTSPSLLLHPNSSFHCHESKSKNLILFICNLPSSASLEFACRSPSCGALHKNEQSVHDESEDEECYVDPNFFDNGYTMAGATGFTVWTGARLLIEALCWSTENHSDVLKDIQSRILDSKVIELGAGVGVVGTYLAASGGQVLVTDLPTLVENAIDDNLQRNEIKYNNKDDAPSWLGSHCHKIGKGWASSASLDWTVPIHEQLTPNQCQSIDFIVASDVVFLVSMLKSLLYTVSSLFASSAANDPSFILSFQRRDSQEGEDR